MNLNQCYIGDCTEGMRAMKADGHQVQTIITSPPYFGLRDYGREGQIGLEETPREYVARLVEIFREAWDLLADNGTVWLNLGDSYAGARRGSEGTKSTLDGTRNNQQESRKAIAATESRRRDNARIPRSDYQLDGLKNKDLIGIPWRVAFALQDDGWYLRQDIIWRKPNPMPESVQDRCTKAHEYIFLLTKSPQYYYDADAIKESVAETTAKRLGQPTLDQQKGSSRANGGAKTNGNMKAVGNSDKRNRRSVWDVPSRPYKGAHFAVFPEELIEPCVLAGSAPGDVVFDPFMGSGTTASVSQRLGRNWLGCELNPEYAELQRERTLQQGLQLT